MTGADVNVCVERVQIERHLTGRVSAVDDGQDAGGSGPRWQISATGKITAVGLVMWLMKMIRVAGVTADQKSSTNTSTSQGPLSACAGSRHASAATHMPGPFERAILMVGRQDLVTRGELHARTTMLTAVVGLGTAQGRGVKRRRKAARASREARIMSARRPRNSTGCKLGKPDVRR